MDKPSRKAIVMGATSGIGMEVAKQLASQGWQVAVCGRREERLRELTATVDNITDFEAVDVTADDAPGKVENLIGRLGGLDLYFHSSGIGWHNVELDNDKEIRTVQTNVVGLTRLVAAMFQWFAVHGGGHIACISSIAGTKGLGAAPAYSASKRFVNTYLESLSQLARIRHLKIRITDIRPGFVATDLIAGSNFPLQLRAPHVAKSIVRAIVRRKSVKTIDWRYRIVVAFWRMLPRWLWIRLRVR